jgi:hypothetical protein
MKTPWLRIAARDVGLDIALHRLGDLSALADLRLIALKLLSTGRGSCADVVTRRVLLLTVQRVASRSFASETLVLIGLANDWLGVGLRTLERGDLFATTELLTGCALAIVSGDDRGTFLSSSTTDSVMSSKSSSFVHLKLFVVVVSQLASSAARSASSAARLACVGIERRDRHRRQQQHHRLHWLRIQP